MTISPKAQEMIDFWNNPRNIPFKGLLIDHKSIGGTNTPCMCAQGQTLFKNGYTVEELMNMEQRKADKETARILGISLSHSVLLREINDSEKGAPQDVLSNPQKYLGPNYKAVLDFWWRLDRLTEEQRETIYSRYRNFYNNHQSEWGKAHDEAWKASYETIGKEFVIIAALYVCGEASSYAAKELIGNIQSPYFIPMFEDLIENHSH